LKRGFKKLKQSSYPFLFLSSFGVTYDPDPDSYRYCVLKNIIEEIADPVYSAQQN